MAQAQSTISQEMDSFNDMQRRLLLKAEELEKSRTRGAEDPHWRCNLPLEASLIAPVTWEQETSHDSRQNFKDLLAEHRSLHPGSEAEPSFSRIEKEFRDANAIAYGNLRASLERCNKVLKAKEIDPTPFLQDVKRFADAVANAEMEVLMPRKFMASYDPKVRLEDLKVFFKLIKNGLDFIRIIGNKIYDPEPIFIRRLEPVKYLRLQLLIGHFIEFGLKMIMLFNRGLIFVGKRQLSALYKFSELNYLPDREDNVQRIIEQSERHDRMYGGGFPSYRYLEILYNHMCTVFPAWECYQSHFGITFR